MPAPEADSTEMIPPALRHVNLERQVETERLWRMGHPVSRSFRLGAPGSGWWSP